MRPTADGTPGPIPSSLATERAAKAWLTDRMPARASFRGLDIDQLGPADTWAAIDAYYLGGRSAFLAAVDAADAKLVARLETAGVVRSSALALVEHRDEPGVTEQIERQIRRAA